MRSRTLHTRRVFGLVVILASTLTPVSLASDHGDVPQSPLGPRQDANITDLHAFLVGPNLVLALSTNPAVPLSATSYVFPTDVTFEINIDVDSAVDPTDPLGDGGTVVDPSRIREDVVFRIHFDDDGSARIKRIDRRPGRRGARASVREARPAAGGPVDFAQRDGGSRRDADPGLVAFFAGLRDDPFIRGPRTGRNVGSIVLELPLASVLGDSPVLLIWATAKCEDAAGLFQDLDGRALKSMFAENADMNRLHPRFHLSQMGATPDVMILDTSRPVAFPNGRALTDDVVDLVNDPRILANDAPFPAENDLPFLDAFPYLAAPHPAP